ncbi:helix-turn-helix domain containing protein [Frigidibacter sp. RF13]|uniref:TetR/AcrR family transcriptional regulator n=1 Tax=Frigidibacter sp. RF13 TaxID=2997340 RepID=UPI00226D428C|nr:TetR/AcrR family transcriptional regulator [Frigidibacter sp. RF13]MCY1128112.1 helix-turn-helix domain containing protein [Frigidibacter sp. RF13]
MNDPPDTRSRIVSAAADLFYGEGIRAVSVDAIAERAGVTKRTLYYHFDSKDQLVAAYLSERDQPNLKLFQNWYRRAEGDAEKGVRIIFAQLAKAANNRKWNGCGFLRTAAELANMPGHPAILVARTHKKRVEGWLSGALSAAGYQAADDLARQVMLLLDGAFALVLMHRDPAYMLAAGEAAATLLRAAASRQT